ncbi:MAG: helix-turn-helix transcriptional regulator [Actinomycetota bacterium]|nr:helix-turn-helix transcriptional regulator [Actinomycetota bacterium]
MTSRPLPARARRAALDLGEHLRTWRKLQGLTADQVAQRAGVDRTTIGRLERGEATVGLDIFLSVALVLGQIENLVRAMDPYESALGRARADETLPKRVRR